MIDPGGYTTFATGVIMIGVAGWLLYVRRRNLAILAFSLSLLVTGTNASISPFAYASDLAPETRLFLSRMNMTFYFARPFMLGLFLLAYPHPRRFFGSTKIMPIAVVALLLLFEAIYFLAPTLHRMEYFDEAGRMVLADYGPLTLGGSLLSIVVAGVGFVFLRESLEAPDIGRASALLLVSLGFSIRAAMNIFSSASRFLVYPESLFGEDWATAGRLAGLCAAFFLFPALAHAARRAVSSPDSTIRRLYIWYLAVVVCTMVVAVLQHLFAPLDDPSRVNPVQRSIDGALGLVFMGLVTYALVRHRFLDIDLKIKWTIKRSTLIGIFIAVFFVSAQVAQAFLTTEYGWALGGLVAGLLLLAINPLQRFATHVADKTMPNVSDTLEYRERRKLEVYRVTLEEMLADGTVSVKERRSLLKLQEALGIDPATATRLEKQLMEKMEADH